MMLLQDVLLSCESVKHMRDLWDKYISVPERRQRLFWQLPMAFMLLLPISGWIPLLAIWSLNSFMLYRETPHSRIRFFYAAMGIASSAALIVNLIMRMYVFFQYFGFFTK